MTGDSRSDGELLADLPRQPEVMGVLYERHARAVFRYLARRAGPPAAEDLLSEVFIIALSASARVVAHDSGSALPWLYGIALNVLRAYFRRQPPATGMAPDLGMDWDAVDERLDAFAERGRLRAALDGLADSDRELLLLVAWEGLTPAEAAAALGTNLGASATEADRKPTRWLSSLRAKALIGSAVATAGAAAAATVIAMPSSPADSAGSSVKPTVTATLTAATVLDRAAQAAGSQPGWPNARYWYSEDKYICGGQFYTDQDWISRYGSGVVEKTGPENGSSSCSAHLFTAPIAAGAEDTVFGPYTWSQLFALPTDPAKLEPKLMADSQNTIYQHPVTAAQWESQQDSFQYVMMDLLTDTPAPPALREALFKVAASIPGAKVTGHYTDPLGRTGTAVQLGQVTIVVDPANGLVLDEANGPGAVMFVAEGPATSEPKLVESGNAFTVAPSITPTATASAQAAAKP